jgi:hypothetical protein
MEGTMTLIDDYLRIVGLLLPEAQREDITAELRDVILTRIEAREAELGRPLTEEETEQVLRAVGHPLVVAARYRGGPQHVVGPALYPYWAFFVKAAVGLQILVAAIVFILNAFGGGDVARALGQAIISGVSGAATLIGIGTIVAWTLERSGVRIAYLDRWRMRDLRGLEYVAGDWGVWRERLEAAGREPPPRAPRSDPERRRRVIRVRSRRSLAGQALGAITVGCVLIVWWLDIVPLPLFGHASDLRQFGVEPGPLASLDWAGFRAALFWPVMAYAIAVLLDGIVILAWPRAVRLQGFVDLAIGGGVLAACVWVWRASPLAQAVHIQSVADLVVRLSAAFDRDAPLDLAPWLSLAVIIAAFGGVGRCVRGAWKLLGGVSYSPVDRAAQLS